MDAESAFNTIRNNKIHTDRRKSKWYKPKRELISIDGSSHNLIVNNTFAALYAGGIYVYRNCGFKGMIRQATPSHNRIINNVFVYKKYAGPKPSVYLGAKEGLFKDTLSWNCNDDDGYPFGSSRDDADYARYNVVMQNQIYKRVIRQGTSYRIATLRDHIVQGGGHKNRPNYIGHNELVERHVSRPAGCYVRNGYKRDFLLHNEIMDVFPDRDGVPECRSYRYLCTDGVLQRQNNTPDRCSLKVVSLGCRASGNNAGCAVRAHCPRGTHVIGGRAACNLEYGSVSTSQLSQVPINKLRVVKRSDSIWGSECRFHRTRTAVGTRSISGLPAGSYVNIGCKERDRNGGDCHIRAQLYCAGTPSRMPPRTTRVVSVRRAFL